MDQMLDAGEDYLEKNFKVNDKLFKRAIDRTKKILNSPTQSMFNNIMMNFVEPLNQRRQN